MAKTKVKIDPISKERHDFFTQGHLTLEDYPITLRKRPNSTSIQCDFTTQNGNRIRKSTGTADYETARNNAINEWKIYHSTYVGTVLSDFIDHQSSTSQTQVTKSCISVIKRNLVPFFENIRLDELNYRHVHQWEDWRTKPRYNEKIQYKRGPNILEYDFTPKLPKAGTIKKERVYLVQALSWYALHNDETFDLKILDEVRFANRYRPQSRNTKKKNSGQSNRSREYFDANQEQFLIKYYIDFETSQSGTGKFYEKRLMGFYARLLLASGMRPGKEISEIQWSNIKEINRNNFKLIEIDQCGNGKTGQRIIKCNPQASEIMEGLKNLLQEFGHPTSGNSYLFPCNRLNRGEPIGDLNKSFQSSVKSFNWDNIEQYTLYSCRHTYITKMISKGMTLTEIAINCGTSVEMIERYYTHLKSDDVANALIRIWSAPEN